MPDEEQVAHFFIDDESGEGWQLIGQAGDVPLTVGNIKAYVQVAIDSLLCGRNGETMTLTLRRKDMTEAEVAALPVV